jgi:hypothetical protein
MEQSEGASDGKMRAIQLQRQSLQKLTKKVVAYALYLSFKAN